MDEPYEQLLRDMGIALDRLASKVPAPQRVAFDSGFVFRYAERTAEQAIVQKLARIITGLRAAQMLLEGGLLQEQAVIQRVVNESHEDVLFLSYSILRGEEPNHKRFLAEFYDEGIPGAVIQNRSSLPRRKIQAYLARTEPANGNPSDNQAQARTLSKLYSGYVHGASPNIMDSYGGTPPQFHVSGMLGTPMMKMFEYDIWNYFYRGFIAFGLAAKAFGDEELFQNILIQKRNFELKTGRES